MPYAWNATDLSDASQRGSIGWFRKDFLVPRAPAGSTWRLRFESVNYRARVYLNGRELGRHEGASVPFELPARGLRRGVNRLVVRADNRRRSTDLPPGRDQLDGRPGGGWWNYGGILREVYLRRVRGVDIAELLVRPALRCRACDASVLVRATVRNDGRRRRRVALRASVGGMRARSRAVVVPGRSRRVLSATARISDPVLWEPGQPELYPVSVRVSGGRGAVAAYRTHVGIRSVRVSRSGRLLLNGRPVKLFGASIHEEHPQVGGALSPAHRAELFQSLVDLGATVMRAHYPLHPEFLEMADRAGILVWDQIPFYQVRNEAIGRQSVRSKGLAYLAATIRRDQNHPSVFAWSVGNELSSRVTAGQARYLSDARRLARALDRTRLTALDFAGYPSVGPVRSYRGFDALGVNSYFGWYPGPGGQVIEREELGPYLDRLHGYYRRQALFVTEFGAEANRSGPIDEKGTYEFQRELLQYHVETYSQKPYLNGAITWILRDFRVRPGWDGGNPKPQPPVNFKGLLSENGQPKPSYEELARLYRNLQPVL